MVAHAMTTILRASALWALGKSTGDISNELGLSRHSICSMARRKRDLFPNRGSTGRSEEEKAKRVKRLASQTQREVKPAAAVIDLADDLGEHDRAAHSAARIDAFRPLPGDEPMLVVDALVAGRCKWPVHTDDDPFSNAARFFCGCQRVSLDRPYCAAHEAMAYSKGTSAERNAVAAVEREMRFAAARAA